MQALLALGITMTQKLHRVVPTPCCLACHIVEIFVALEEKPDELGC